MWRRFSEGQSGFALSCRLFLPLLQPALILVYASHVFGAAARVSVAQSVSVVVWVTSRADREGEDGKGDMTPGVVGGYDCLLV